VHALGSDGAALRERAGHADVAARMAVLREAVGDRKLVVRVDRTELSKNIVRGLLAYQVLLRNRPQWRGRVVHLAFAYPSRHDLPEYREYTAAVQRVAQEINDEFATEHWQPLILHVNDDFPRSLAAYRMADVLLVNPIRDGMNLVAKEFVAARDDEDGVLVLSELTGAAQELKDALLINPYDIDGFARAIERAITMPEAERHARMRVLRRLVAGSDVFLWASDILEHLDQLERATALSYGHRPRRASRGRDRRDDGS
jgi:trehalose 6-phosphate synthase